MDFPVAYDAALRLHPIAVEGAVAMLRKSRSKYRNADPSTLKWNYSWGVTTESQSFADVISNIKARKPRRRMTLDERVGDEVARSIVHLVVADLYYSPLGEVPAPILDVIAESNAKEIASEGRAAVMSDEERAADVRRILASLGPTVIQKKS